MVADEPTHVLALDPRSFAAFVDRRGVRKHVMRQLAEWVRKADRLHAAG